MEGDKAAAEVVVGKCLSAAWPLVNTIAEGSAHDTAAGSTPAWLRRPQWCNKVRTTSPVF